MSVDIAVIGTAQSRIKQEYWQERQLCNEIFQTVYSTGIKSKYDWAVSITVGVLKVAYTVKVLTNPQISI